jgi:hypothetical protein
LSTVALLVAVAGGGTAVAAGLAKDSVASRHIKDGTVRSLDVRDGSLTGQDVDESSLGTVPSANSARTSDLARSADKAVRADRAQTADELAGSMRASVNAAGELQAQSVDAVSAEQTATPGRYLVTFKSPVTGCFLLAGVASSATDRIVGFASAWVAPVAVNPASTKVTVETHAPDPEAGLADAVPDPRPFSLTVSC